MLEIIGGTALIIMWPVDPAALATRSASPEVHGPAPSSAPAHGRSRAGWLATAFEEPFDIRLLYLI